MLWRKPNTSNNAEESWSPTVDAASQAASQQRPRKWLLSSQSKLQMWRESEEGQAAAQAKSLGHSREKLERERAVQSAVAAAGPMPSKDAVTKRFRRLVEHAEALEKRIAENAANRAKLQHAIHSRDYSAVHHIVHDPCPPPQVVPPTSRMWTASSNLASDSTSNSQQKTIPLSTMSTHGERMSLTLQTPPSFSHHEKPKKNQTQ